MSEAQDTADKAGQDTSAPAERQNDQPRVITDADRAADPLGVARREREQQNRHEHRGDGGRYAKADEGRAGSKPDAQQQKSDGKDGKGDKPDVADGQQDQQQRKPGQVPQQALDAERRKRQERDGEVENLRREVARLTGMVSAGQRQQPGPQQPHQEQPKPPPEFWDDPNAALEHRMRGALDPMQQRLDQHLQAQEQRAQAERTHYSRMFAVSTHGEAAVTGALSALQGHLHANPGDVQRVETQLSQSMDPVGDVVRWHKQQTAMQTYGADPEAYIKAEVERRMAEAQADQQQRDPPPAAQRQPSIQQQPLPSSFAAQRSGGPRGGAAYGGPRPLSEILPRG